MMSPSNFLGVSKQPCKICGNHLSATMTNSLIINDVPDSTFNLSSKTTTLHVSDCKSCGSVQLINVPLSSDYEVVHRSLGVSTSYREEKSRQIEHFIRMKGLYQAKVVEIGCGNGQYLEILKTLGIKNITGLESGKTNYLECLKKGFQVSQGSLHSLLKNNKIRNDFDAFVTFHFLEHMPDPVKFVTGLYQIIKPGGVGLIEVPNYDYIESNNVWLEFTKDHRFYYRNRTLCYLLSKCGFNVELLEENNGGICLTAVVNKPKKKSGNFSSMKKQIKKDLIEFKKMIDGLGGPFAIYGAGHYAQLLVNTAYRQFGIRPLHIFDSNQQKCGYPLCKVVIEQGTNAAAMQDCDTIIVICGIYNDEVGRILSKSGKKVIKWR